MASKKAQPASPFALVNSIRRFSSKIRKNPVQKPTETRYNKDGQVIGTKTDSAGMQFFGKQVAKAMNSGAINSPKAAVASKAAVAPKGPTTAQKRAASMAAPSVSKVANVKPTGVGVAGLAAKPKAMNVTPGRTYTDKEKQVNALLMTGKKKDGTMKASAQRKIQNIRKK